jgi:hypothetical protein
MNAQVLLVEFFSVTFIVHVDLWVVRFPDKVDGAKTVTSSA